jgi:hypothetical protein
MTTKRPFKDEQELLDWMTKPSQALIEFIPQVESPLVILGAGGKMGPSLAVLALQAARAAAHPLKVIAVSRFSTPGTQRWLESNGVKTLRADLMDPAAYKNLPASGNVIYLVGLKFGTAENPSMTWATNVLPPVYCCQAYAGARIAALSSGNVYPLVPVDGPGSRESDPLVPLGEYANSCVARERIFQYGAERHRNGLILLRLSYALDMRYGVLVDMAQRVLQRKPLDLRTGSVNCIWQGDANEMILRSLAYADRPGLALNLTGTERYRVRDLACKFGAYFQIDPVFVGYESGTALISNTELMVSKLGEPRTPIETLIQPTAEWLISGGGTYDKPTHFDVRDGVY